MTAQAPARPRYRQIADEWLARLRAGTHPIGAMLPTETELCALHGASRHTIREALRLVEEAGLVARRQGSGTSVIAHDTPSRFVQDFSRLGGLLQYPEETRLTPLRARDAALDAETAAQLGLDPAAAWLRVEGIRRVRVTEAPICYTTLHIPKAYAAIVDEIGLAPGPVYALLERRFGLRLASVEVDLSACGVPEAQAELLEVPPGAPALLIRRRYLDEHGQVFEHSESCHPAPRFTYRATLRREV